MNVLRLEEILKNSGISITGLAERMGVNRQTIYYYIKQDDKNPLSQLQKIADALEIPLIELFSDSSKDELTALINHKGEFYKATTLKELEEIVEKIKANKDDNK